MTGRHALAGRSRARRAPGHRRGGAALLVAALSSTGNVSVSLAVAHTGSIAEVGHFVLAFSAYVLATGCVRAAVTDGVLAEPGAGPGERRDAAGRVVLLGLLAGAGIAAAGLVTGSPYLALLGLALPGLALYEHVKVVSLGTGRPRRALRQEALWTVAALAGVAAGTVLRSGPVAPFAVWCAAGAAIGVASAVTAGLAPWPGWRLPRPATLQAAGFAGQHLITFGSAQVALAALAVTAGAAVVGAIGAARVLLGPAALLINAVGMLIVARLGAQSGRSPARRLRGARRVALLAAGPAALVALGCALVPDRVGRLVLGGSWSAARPLVPVLALEAVAGLLAAVAYAGHRVERRAGRALALGATLGAVRVAGLAAAGVWWDALGVAACMAGLAGLTVLAWWGSYTRLLRPAAGASAGDPSDPSARRTRDTTSSTSELVRSP
ncbi:hypothetical protein RB614_27180 [Phytohabitans sp. ZYX-F-186]|uniref:O-antigen/teichoic acid export membrane protein n=1 Tax=Phytohabitans maris TaxID=3071409 RepID=A0ABU0ZPD5_9ACTN|nr:hypothetical protein [Phytohabitans sp. ZYX-F-186]MDQ7908214.1 hypothetical protein [Phytohabitans sp. ZYX-F-186]